MYRFLDFWGTKLCGVCVGGAKIVYDCGVCEIVYDLGVQWERRYSNHFQHTIEHKSRRILKIHDCDKSWFSLNHFLCPAVLPQ